MISIIYIYIKIWIKNERKMKISNALYVYIFTIYIRVYQLFYD